MLSSNALAVPSSPRLWWSTTAVIGAAVTYYCYSMWRQEHSKEKSTDATQDNDGWELWHAGYCTATFVKFPAISTVTVFSMSSSTEQVMASYRHAVTALATRHPMLRAKLAVRNVKNDKAGLALWVQPGARPADDEAFWSFSTDLSGDTDLQKVLQEHHAQQQSSTPHLVPRHLLPRLLSANLLDKPPVTEDVAKDGGPLFTVRLLVLPANQYALQVNVSHAIADGTTYYRLVDDLHRLAAQSMYSREPLQEPALDWTSSRNLHVNHEMDPGHQDAHLMNTSLSFVCAVLPSVFQAILWPRPYETLVISKKALQQVKDEYRKANRQPPYVSSNDILMAALQQAQPRHEIGLLFRNERAWNKALQPHDAGNWMTRVFYPATVGRRASAIRSMMQTETGRHFAPNTLPSGFVRRTKWFMGSSWTTAQGTDNWIHPQVIPNARLLGHVPHPDFVTIIFDLAVIFTLDEHHLGVMHNFYPSHMTAESRALLDRLTVKAATDGASTS